jgi:hypothetical protein
MKLIHGEVIKRYKQKMTDNRSVYASPPSVAWFFLKEDRRM